MRARQIAAAVLAIALGACSATTEEESPAVPADVSWPELKEMVEAFGYEQGIRQFCEDTSADSLDRFMDELAQNYGMEPLMARATSRADEIRAEFAAADPDEEQEYVCTVEMFAGSEDRANQARADWQSIKDRSDG